MAKPDRTRSAAARPFWLAAALSVTLALAACDGAQDREARYLARGQELFEQGDYVKASLEFRNALQINPTSIEAMFYLGRIAESQGDLSNALGAFTKVVEQDPKNVPALLKISQYALLTQNLDEARSRADQALAVDANNADALALKAAVLLRENMLTQAEAEAQKAQAIQPDNVSAIAVLAGIRNRQGKIDEALALVDAALARDPSQESLHRLKLEMLRSADRKDALAEAYRSLIAAVPGNQGYKAEFAAMLADGGHLDEAEATYHQAIDAAPEDENLKLDLVRFLEQKRGWQAAEQQLVAFSKAAPDDPRYSFALADLYAANERLPQARAALEAIAEREGTNPMGLRARAGLARLALLEGDLAEAEARATEVLKIDAANNDALLIRSGLAADRGNFQDAIVDLRTILRSEPNSISALAMLAKAYQGNGEPELATDSLRNLVRADPADSAARVELAEQLRGLGRDEEALKELEQALQLDPNYLPALKGKAILMIRQGNYAIAEAIGKAIGEAAQGTVDGKIIVGAAAIGKQDYDRAIAELASAVEAAPTSSEALSLLVQAYNAAGKPEAALEHLGRVAKQDPANANAWIALADANYDLKRPRDAEAALQQAIAARPAWVVPYLKLGSLYAGDGRTDAALETFEAGLAKNPGHEGLLVNRALAEETVGSYPAARASYEAVLQKNPQSLVAANNLAALIADVWPDDAPLMDQARRLAEPFRNSNDPLLIDTLGWIQLRLGNLADATQLLERAARALPEHQQIRYHLGMAYRAQGDTKRAKDELAKAVAGTPDYRGIDDAKKTLSAL